MTEKDVVGGGLDARQVLDGDEGDVVDEGSQDTEQHLCSHQQGSFVLNLPSWNKSKLTLKLREMSVRKLKV